MAQYEQHWYFVKYYEFANIDYPQLFLSVTIIVFKKKVFA